MSLEDEIRREKEKMQADINAEEQRKRKMQQLKEALEANGMEINYPILRMPTSDLRAVINETMSSMKFNEPKIVRNMPDGNVRVRPAWRQGERADTYSFDVKLGESTGKSDYPKWVYFFNNGSIAYAEYDNEHSYSLKNWAGGISVPASTIRQKIIETLAYMSLDNGGSSIKSTSNGLSSDTTSQSKGCYIATAVYGSYDCPEVWILRRYRDFVLLQNPMGRLFVKSYYYISPTLVKLFGNTGWFKKFWKGRLDCIVSNLRKRGISDESYND